MGVKYLWDIIDETKSKETLDYMRGKIVSVDLSIWIVEAMKTLQFKTSVLKPHLRNMFYRILALRKLGIKLVFVTEGEAPDLKQNTMKKRNESRYGVKTKTKSRVGRSRFQNTIKECCRLLDLLGMPHVKAAGEAEEMCAVLNLYGHSDGCLTNDGDFFLYGGQTIFRDFGIDPKDPHIFVYEMEKIQSQLNINRNDMIGVALMAGCDYTSGIAGVGKGLVTNLLGERCYSDDLLSRFKNWYSKDSTSEQLTKSEVIIARKALKMDNFLNQQIIDEYQINRDNLDKMNEKLKWGYPNIKGLQEFLFAKMEWPFEYTLSKVMQLASSTYLEKMDDNIFYPVPITPTHIVKTRSQHGVALVEINWEKDVSQVYSVDTKWDNCPDVFTTLENHQFVLKLLPNLVDTYVQLKENKNAGKGKKKEGKSKRTVKCKEAMKENLFSEEAVDVYNKIKMDKKKVTECKPAMSQLNASSSQDYLVQGFGNANKIKGDFLTDVLCEDIRGIALDDEQEVDGGSHDSENILPLFQRLKIGRCQGDQTKKGNGCESAVDQCSLFAEHEKQSLRKEINCPQVSLLGNNSIDIIDVLTTSVLNELGEETCHDKNGGVANDHGTKDARFSKKENLDRLPCLNSPSQGAKVEANIQGGTNPIHRTPRGLRVPIIDLNLIENTPVCFRTETPSLHTSTLGPIHSSQPRSPLVASTPLLKEFKDRPILQDITAFTNLGVSIILGHSMELFDLSNELDKPPVNNPDKKCLEEVIDCGDSILCNSLDLFEPDKSVKLLSKVSGFGDSILCDSLDLASVSYKDSIKIPLELCNHVDTGTSLSENYEDFLRKKFQVSQNCDGSMENISNSCDISLTRNTNCQIEVEGSPLSLTERLKKGCLRI